MPALAHHWSQARGVLTKPQNAAAGCHIAIHSFEDETTADQRGCGIYPKSHSRLVIRPDMQKSSKTTDEKTHSRYTSYKKALPQLPRTYSTPRTWAIVGRLWLLSQTPSPVLLSYVEAAPPDLCSPSTLPQGCPSAVLCGQQDHHCLHEAFHFPYL